MGTVSICRRRAVLSMLGIAIATVMAAVGVDFAVESGRYRVHPDELPEAKLIRSLHGSYRARGANDWRITSVWLNHTAATDKDVEEVLTLTQLEHLDISGTQATNAIIDSIVSHLTLKSIRIDGSFVDNDAIAAALWRAGRQVYVEGVGRRQAERDGK